MVTNNSFCRGYFINQSVFGYDCFIFYWCRKTAPLGYSSVVLSFNHKNPYPTSSTCAVELTLPTMHQDFDMFKRHLDVAFTMHGGFGLC